MISLVAALLLTFAARAGDWRAELRAAVAEAHRDDPTQADWAATSPVVPTRNGGLRVVDPGATWGPVLMAERLLDGGEAPEVRAALAAAITPRIDAWPEIAAGLVDQEADPQVLAVLLGGLQRVPADLAMPRLEAALAHADPAVRIEAAAVLGRHAEGGRAETALVAALADGEPQVRGLAARALGRHVVAGAFEPLRAALADPHATVRLQALRALARVDLDRCRALPEVAALVADPDAGVARAASELAR